MNGLLKIGSFALLALMPVLSLANVPESQILNPFEGDVELFPIEDTSTDIMVEPLDVDSELVDSVDILLERAKLDNAKRSNMRTAKLSETECLALAMYHEARGEGTIGMKAVAFVIYNRAKSGKFPKSLCEVILQKNQFSFTFDKRPDNIRSWDCYKRALALAVYLYDNNGFEKEKSPVGSALFFHSLATPYRWVYAKGRKFVATLGGHHFFK